MGKKGPDFCPFLFSSASYHSPPSSPSSSSSPSSPSYSYSSYSYSYSSSYYSCHSSPSYNSPFPPAHPLSPTHSSSTTIGPSAACKNLNLQCTDQSYLGHSVRPTEEIIADSFWSQQYHRLPAVHEKESGQGNTSEGKEIESDDREIVLKKPRHGISADSSLWSETASVLLEADQHRRFLQVQVQTKLRHGNTSKGKKKIFEDTSDIDMRSPKYEISRVLSMQMQVPKAKLGDKITALQELVSPFGRTDIASVLLEAIGYIRFLQGQVEVLSKSNNNNKKKVTLFGVTIEECLGLEKKDKGDMKLDLRSKGLCLVPISFYQPIH